MDRCTRISLYAEIVERVAARASGHVCTFRFRSGYGGLVFNNTGDAGMATETSTRLTEAIRSVRGDRTRRVFAALVGCTERTLYDWETAFSRPRQRHHLRALAAEGVSLELLLADDESTAGE